MMHKIGEVKKMDKFGVKDLELEDENLLSRGDKIHGETLKGYKVDTPQTTKLTPLKK